jgi:hypothetical protein
MANGPAPDQQREEQSLGLLVGAWHGTGTLEYPTIDTFPYREVFTVRMLGPGWPLHYLQETWKQLPHAEAPSHVETGFITADGDGEVMFHNAQGNDRVEVLSGRLMPTGDRAWRLELASIVHGDDSRMRSATRTITLDSDSLSYSMSMATDRVDAPTLHLTAHLTRSRS